jgi:MarR family 2-MHQ and catechol resistance regulon transcriptional repressor
MMNAKTATSQDFLPLMRELVRTYQAFATFDANLHRNSGSGLTVSQADVIFTLGNTQGMTCSEVGEKTLITKGTLTGVIDRLVSKGLVKRSRLNQDARCIHLSLTLDGEALFEEVFPKHIGAIRERFHLIDPAKRKHATSLLAEIRRAF